MAAAVRKVIDHPDEHHMEPGTVIYGRRVHWRVTAVEPVESKVWPFRWRYTVEPLGPHGRDFDELVAIGAETLVSYRRGEGPADVFGSPFAA